MLTVEDAKKKWNVLRTRYNCNVKKGKHNFTYAEELAFLKPYLRREK